MQIKVLLVDDHRIMLEGLKSILANHRGIEVVGEANDGREAVRLALELKPDIVIMDLSMPGMNGIEATREITEQLPSTKVLALSMHNDKRFISRALRHGASGYILKESAMTELVEAIKSLMIHKTYLSPQIADVVLNDYKSQLIEREYAADSMLSKREREVLQLFAEGHSTKEIAAALTLSVKTIETHRSQIMTKLDMHSIAELVKFAIREGLTRLE
jgi:DNA-binding NarL/FixJ family response regulator